MEMHLHTYIHIVCNYYRYYYCFVYDTRMYVCVPFVKRFLLARICHGMDYEYIIEEKTLCNW